MGPVPTGRRPSRPRSAPKPAHQASWEKLFAQLVALKRRRGHLHGPLGRRGTPLVGWVSRQRHQEAVGKLPPDRRRRLLDLGLPLLGRPPGPSPRFQEASDYLAQHGHLGFPLRHPLHSWAQSVRQDYRDGTLSRPAQVEVRRLGLPLSTDEIWWELKFGRLCAHLAQPSRLPLNRLQGAGRWLHEQLQHPPRTVLARKQRRRLARAGALAPGVLDLQTSHQKARITFDRRWQATFERLLQFHRTSGHFSVPRSGRHLPLHHWLIRQRKHAKAGTLAPERRRQLERAGVPLTDTNELEWEINFELLTAFVEECGHARVPRHHREDPALGQWVSHQRDEQARGQLQPDRKARLDSLGFIWKVHDEAWQSNLQRLTAFQKRFGHAHVPQKWPEDPGLARWLAGARIKKRQGELPQDRARELEALGVVWTGEEVLWERQYLHLVEFAQAQGHTRVSAQGHRKLYDWSKEQRTLRQEGRLNPARVERLTRAGFDWTDPRERERAEREEAYCFELLAFRKAHGHFWAQEGQLRDVVVDWLRDLRGGRAAPSLKAQKLLGQLGLPMTPSDWEWERNFARLAEYQTRTKGTLAWGARSGGPWLNEQLAQHQRGELLHSREDRLAELGLFD